MKISSFIGLVGCSLLVAACSGQDNGSREGEGEMGTVRAALTSASAHDVVSVAYKVVDAAGDCSGPAIAQTTVVLEDENLPTSVQPAGGGDSHRFADALFTVPPGSYLVCATPLAAGGGASAECGPASTPASVLGGATTEILLISQCAGDPNGGLDGTTVLNDPPSIDSLNIGPSKYITACETANLSAVTSDPNGDAVDDYAWSILSGPAGATVVGSGSSAVFTPGAAGDYQLSLTVSDVHDGQASLSFPIHVSPCACGPIFTETFADNSKGWTLDTDWGIGSATGSFGQVYGNGDPTSDHTGAGDNGVAGVVIGGNAPVNQHGFYYLTSPVIAATAGTPLTLDYWRWLNSDYVPYMQNSVEVFDGSSWIAVWQSGGPPGVQDGAWTEQTMDISAYANPSLQVRFGFDITSAGVYTVSSWNVDDVTIGTPCGG